MTTFGDTVYQWGGTPVGGDFFSLVADAQVFYYDPQSGNDGASGKTPKQAVKTIAVAEALLTAGRGDVLVCMEGWETVTSSVTMDRGGITLIASTYGVSSVHEANHSIYSSTASVPIFVLETGLSIIGLQLYSADARDPSTASPKGATVVADGDSTAWKGDYFQIKDCYFSGAASPSSGIHVYGSEKFTIENNYFYGWGQNMSSGISLRSGGTTQVKNFVIRRNFFNELDNGIRAFAGTFTGGLIQENSFINCTTNAIHTNGGAAGEVLVAGNWYDQATDTGAYDVDITSKAWKFCGNHYIET